MRAKHPQNHATSPVAETATTNSFGRRTFLRGTAMAPLTTVAVGAIGMGIAMADGTEAPTGGETKIVELAVNTEHEAVEKVETEGASVDNPELAGTEAAQVSGFVTMVAASWAPENRPDLVEFQPVLEDGSTGEWLNAEFIDDGETTQDATEAIWVGPSVAVNVRANRAGEDISELITVHLIATSEAPSDAPLAVSGPSGGSTLVRSKLGAVFTPGTHAPAVFSRAEWGANEALANWKPSPSAETRSVVLHHSAGSNTYTMTQSAQIVRGYYEYHAKTLGWGDIGYNALVDKYGQIFEGRKGGMQLNVGGAHAAPFNTHTFGISLMGNYMAIPAPEVALQSIAKIAAWKLRGIFAQGVHEQVVWTNVTDTRARQRGTVTLTRFFSHRDVNYTACPGDYLYTNQMARIRTLIATYMERTDPTHYNAFTAAGGIGALGTVTAVEQSISGWRVTRLSKGLILTAAGRTTANTSPFSATWQPTWGRPLENSSGNSQRFENGTATILNGATKFTAGATAAPPATAAPATTAKFNPSRATVIGRGWSTTNTIAVGNFSGDASADLILKLTDHTLRLYEGTSSWGWTNIRTVGNGWGAFDLIFGGHDWDGDGRADLIARHKPSGDLYLYPGNGLGGFKSPRKIGNGWNGFTRLTVIPKFHNNLPAILAVDASGRAHIYGGNGTGGFSSLRKTYGYGWNALRSIAGVSPSANGENLLALGSDGSLLFYKFDSNAGVQLGRNVLDLADNQLILHAGTQARNIMTVSSGGLLRRYSY